MFMNTELMNQTEMKQKVMRLQLNLLAYIIKVEMRKHVKPYLCQLEQHKS